MNCGDPGQQPFGLIEPTDALERHPLVSSWDMQLAHSLSCAIPKVLQFAHEVAVVRLRSEI